VSMIGRNLGHGDRRNMTARQQFLDLAYQFSVSFR
jgi:hypothetical protein